MNPLSPGATPRFPAPALFFVSLSTSGDLPSTYVPPSTRCGLNRARKIRRVLFRANAIGAVSFCYRRFFIFNYYYRLITIIVILLLLSLCYTIIINVDKFSSQFLPSVSFFFCYFKALLISSQEESNICI